MITSLKNWRQRLFKDKAIIGLAYTETHLCLVQIRLQKGSINIGPWIIEHYSHPDLAKKVKTIFAQRLFETHNIAASLSSHLIDLIYYDIPDEQQGSQHEFYIAQKLAAQTTYQDLTHMAVTIIEDFPYGALLVCDKTKVNNYIELLAQTHGELISLDWQPMSVIRILWGMMMIIMSFPSFRLSILETINQYEVIHLEALGAAINGLFYVAD